jgi:hypothetical protein
MLKNHSLLSNDSWESKIELWATFIFDTFKIFLVSCALLTWLFFSSQMSVERQGAIFLKMTHRCQ